MTERFTEAEVGILQSLVRGAIRKADKGIAGLRAKHRDDYDNPSLDERLALLEGLYRKLGGDPTRVSNRRST